MSLIPSPESITFENVEAVLLDLMGHVPIEDGEPPLIFSVRPWHGKYVDYFSSKDRNEWLVSFCESLRKRTEDPRSHLDAIDILLSPFLNCRVSVEGFEPGYSANSITLRACDLLKRLPSPPLELEGLPEDLNGGYFYSHSSQEGSIDHTMTRT